MTTSGATGRRAAADHLLRMSHLDSLERAYRVLGLEGAAGGDGVFQHLVPARIIKHGRPSTTRPPMAPVLLAGK